MRPLCYMGPLLLLTTRKYCFILIHFILLHQGVIYFLPLFVNPTLIMAHETPSMSSLIFQLLTSCAQHHLRQSWQNLTQQLNGVTKAAPTTTCILPSTFLPFVLIKTLLPLQVMTIISICIHCHETSTRISQWFKNLPSHGKVESLTIFTQASSAWTSLK